MSIFTTLRELAKGHRLPESEIAGYRTNSDGHIFPVTESQAAAHPVKDIEQHKAILRAVAEHTTGARGGDYRHTDRLAGKHLGADELRAIATKHGHTGRAADLTPATKPAPAYIARSLESSSPRHASLASEGHALSQRLLKERKRLDDPASVPRQTFITYSHSKLTDESGDIAPENRKLLHVAGDKHKQAVQAKLDAGQEVAPEVMQDYPGLRGRNVATGASVATGTAVTQDSTEHKHQLSPRAATLLRRAFPNEPPHSVQRAIKTGVWTAEAARHAGPAIGEALDDADMVTSKELKGLQGALKGVKLQGFEHKLSRDAARAVRRAVGGDKEIGEAVESGVWPERLRGKVEKVVAEVEREGRDEPEMFGDRDKSVAEVKALMVRFKGDAIARLRELAAK